MRLAGLALPVLLVVGGCASPIVSIRRGYDFQKIRRVALLGFADFPGAPESGNVCASVLEQYLVEANYQVVERRKAGQVLEEQYLNASGVVGPLATKELGQLLEVDALVLGNVTAYVPPKEETVIVDAVDEKSMPNMVTVTRRERRMVESDDSQPTNAGKPRKPRYEWVSVEHQEQKGNNTTRTIRKIPYTYLIDGKVGMSVRLVEINSGEVLWSGTDNARASTLEKAAATVSHRILRAVKGAWPRKPDAVR